MNVWIRVAAVSICTFAAGCGGGGGGGRSGAMTPALSGGGVPGSMTPAPSGGAMPGSMTPAPSGDGSVVPQSVLDFQGLYAVQETDPDDPDVEIAKAQALITSDGRALIYVDDQSDEDTFVVVFDGRLTVSGGNATLTQATAYITDEVPVPASGLLRFDTDPNDDIDLLVDLTIGGQTFTVGLQSQPDAFMTPSSLAALRGRYQNDSGVELTIDPAGNVIVSQDPDTSCGAMGQVADDMPAVNVYSFSLDLMCADNDDPRNGRYTGRLAIVDGLLGFIIHSDTLPLFDSNFERVAP